jgi:hypothetical protein
LRFRWSVGHRGFAHADAFGGFCQAGDQHGVVILETAVDNGILAVPGNQPDGAPLKLAVDHHEDMVGIAHGGLGQAECLRPDAVGHDQGHKGAGAQLHRVVGLANPGKHFHPTPFGGYARADPVDDCGPFVFGSADTPAQFDLTSHERVGIGGHAAILRVGEGEFHVERLVVIDRRNNFVGVHRPAGLHGFIGNDAVKGSNQRRLLEPALGFADFPFKPLGIGLLLGALCFRNQDVVAPLARGLLALGHDQASRIDLLVGQRA